MKDPKLKNIIILGMFSDKKVRQLISTENQQLAALTAIKNLSPNNVIQVIDAPILGISWESSVDFNKKLKKKL